MSAFVVHDQAINRVVTFMLYMDNRGYQFDCIKNPLETGKFNTTPGGAKKLGKAMRELNVAAVKHRYPTKDEMIDVDAYKYETDKVSPFQVLKSLHCWKYQCSEGDFDQNPLFKQMEDFSTELAYALAINSPEYNAAEWG